MADEHQKTPRAVIMMGKSAGDGTVGLSCACTASVVYSKNPHKRTSGLRTLKLKFGQKSAVYIRTHSA